MKIFNKRLKQKRILESLFNTKIESNKFNGIHPMRLVQKNQLFQLLDYDACRYAKK